MSPVILIDDTCSARARWSREGGETRLDDAMPAAGGEEEEERRFLEVIGN